MTRAWPRRGVWTALVLLVAVAAASFILRLWTDVPHIVAGTLPRPQEFERRYVLHPIPAYVHIVPGMVYLIGAPLQLSRRFRVAHLGRHRRLGRVLLGAGFVAGMLGVVAGVWFPFGGPVESIPSVVFGSWFVVALGMARYAIRTGNVAGHRRFMIRAFAVGLGIGTIRVWAGIFQLVGLVALQDGTGAVWFGIAFWLGLGMHVVVAEAYLRRRAWRIGRRARGARDAVAVTT